MATRQRSSWPKRSKAVLTTSWAPTLTPPLATTTSAQATASARRRSTSARLVARDAEASDLRADEARLGGDGRRVAVVDLARAEGRAGLDELIAGGQHRDARPAMDAHGAMAGGDDDGHGRR